MTFELTATEDVEGLFRRLGRAKTEELSLAVAVFDGLPLFQGKVNILKSELRRRSLRAAGSPSPFSRTTALLSVSTSAIVGVVALLMIVVSVLPN